MSANDKLEKVLRDMHVLISKSEVYSGDSIIVSKSELFELLDRLNSGVYEIMDEYELTKQSRDRAEREFKKRGDQILFDSERKAEDVYAAAVMYTDEALTHLLSLMDESMQHIEEVQNHMLSELADKKRLIRDNQMELKSQLQDLVDTGKYLQLIEERNKEIKQEQEVYKTRFGGQKTQDEEQFANVKTEIKINKQYFKDHGLAVDDDEEEEEKKKSADKKGRKAKKPRQTLLKTARELVMSQEQKKEAAVQASDEPNTGKTYKEKPVEAYKEEPAEKYEEQLADAYKEKSADVYEETSADAYEENSAGAYEEIPVDTYEETPVETYEQTDEEAYNEPYGEDEGDELAASIRDHELTEEEIKALSDDLDSEYFDWSEG